MYKSSLSSVDEKELVEAVVVGMSSRDVVVNIGSKSDGVIPRSEFRDMPDIKINDKVKPTDDFNILWKKLIKIRQLYVSDVMPKKWYTVDNLDNLKKLKKIFK